MAYSQDNTSFRSRCNACYRDLSDSEKKIADYVSKNIKHVAHSTISETSASLGIADSTFFKFTKRLGYHGFTDFKVALLTESFDPKISISHEIKKGDSEEAIAKKVFESGKLAIDAAAQQINGKDYKKAVDLIVNSDRVGFFGLGGSNIMAFEAYHKFLRSPVKCIYAADYDMQTMNAALLTKNDCAVIISHSGLTNGANEIASIAKNTKAKIIAITTYPLSPLAKLADVVLVSSVEELEYRTESLPSRMAQYSIINSLFIMVMLRDQVLSKSTSDSVHKALKRVERPENK